MPTLTKYKTKEEKEKDLLFFGIEIEGTNGARTDAATREINAAAAGHVYNSCSDGGGWEVALQPCTLNYLKEKGILKNIIDQYNKHGFLMDESTIAGIHIHVGKEHFEAKQLYNMMEFMFNNAVRFTALFRRKIGHSYYYQGVPGQVPADHLNTLDNCLKGGGGYSAPNTLFCINRKQVPTIEFRCFQSTSSHLVVLAYVELISSLIKYSKQSKILTWSGFKFFILKNESDNLELINLMKNLKIPIKGPKAKLIDPRIISAQKALKAAIERKKAQVKIKKRVLQLA